MNFSNRRISSRRGKSLSVLVISFAAIITIGVCYTTKVRTQTAETIRFINVATEANATILGASINQHLSGNGAAATFDVNISNVRAHALATGDVNNDGIADIVVGAPDATFTVTPAGGSPQTRTNAGIVSVVLGKSGLSGSFDTASHTGITILGAASGDKLGFSVAIGDVNGDGIDDIIIGAPGASFPGSANPPAAARANTGAVFVILGAGSLSAPRVIDLASANAANIALYGVNTGDQFGASAAVGDVGGLSSQTPAEQGVKDMLIGAPGNNGPDGLRASGGAAYVVFGGSYLNPVAGATTVRDLANAPANVIVFGKAGDLLGFSVAIGDVNGGGRPDIVVGAPLADRPLATNVPPATDTGAVFVVFGGVNLIPTVGTSKTFDVAAGQQNVSIYGAGNRITPGADDADHLGFSVAVADVTGDGIADIIAGAPDADGPGEDRSSAGEAYVIQGGPGLNPTSGSEKRIDLFNGSATFTMFGAQAGDRLGATVAAGKYNTVENTTTTPDLIVGAPGANNKAGIVSIVFGGPNLLLVNTRDLFLNQDSLRILGQTPANSDLSNKTLRIRQTLTTSDQSMTPFLQQLIVNVNGSAVVNDDTQAQFATGTLANVIAANTIIPGDATALGDLELAPNPSLALNGSSAFMLVSSSPSLKPGLGSWTVEFWIKRTDTGTGDFPQVIGSRMWTSITDKGWAVALASGSSFKVSAHFADGSTGFDVGSIQSSSGIPVGTWQHWAVVFDRLQGQVRFYKNAALDATDTVPFPTGAADQDTDTVLIGRDLGGARFLAANLDDIRVWNVARTATQIQTNFNQELQGNETGLVAYWNFNARNGNDLTANANNGTLNGGATIADPPDRRFLTGNRVSMFTFPASTTANTSSISWVQTAPAGTNVKIETSLDNGASFQTAVNGGGIPSLAVGDELGWAIATADVNKDGGGDLIIAAPFANVSAGGAFRAQAGIVYVLPSTAAPPPINRPPTVHLTAPNGGETLLVGQNFNITWTATDPDGDSDIKSFQLKLSTDGGANFNFTINPNVAGTARQFTWTVPPGFNTTQGRIRVIVTDMGGLSAQDDSHANFTITDVGVTATITALNGGENLKFDQKFTITWTVPTAVQSLVKGFDLFLSTDGGGSFFEKISPGSDPAQPSILPTTRSFDWTVDRICTTRARVSIVTTSTANVRTSDASKADFSISAPGPTIDTANMFILGDFRLFLLTMAPAGGTEITFTEDTAAEISSDAAGTSFFTFSKPPKIKRNGEKFLSKGQINNVDLGVFFPNGATRVIRITQPTCAITVLKVTRSGDQLMVAASAQAESPSVWQ